MLSYIKTEMDIYAFLDNPDDKTINYLCQSYRRVLKGYYAPPLAFGKTFKKNGIQWKLVEIHGSFTEFQVNSAIEYLKETKELDSRALIKVKKCVGENISVIRIISAN